jgi:hypothetical protein
VPWVGRQPNGKKFARREERGTTTKLLLPHAAHVTKNEKEKAVAPEREQQSGGRVEQIHKKE